MKALCTGFVLILMSMLLVPPAAAAAANAAVRQACMADARRHCSKHFGNPKAVQTCMRANRNKLSAGCKAALGKRRDQLIASCKKRLMPKLKGAGMEKARASIRSCVMAQMRAR
jgi:hypothetical protein